MSDTIIDRLSQNPSEISKEDINTWILQELVDFFEPKFCSLASYAYGPLDNGADIAKRAFAELATETLEKGLYAFLFKSQHWRSGRKIQPYLITCLNRLADNINRDVSSQTKVSIPVCPACKFLNTKEFLKYESRSLRCHTCTIEQNKLEDRINTEKSGLDKTRMESELRLRKIFAIHSRRGYRCPDCALFIPLSYASKQNVSCPYDDHCTWFGHIDELELMTHPLGLSSRNHISLSSNFRCGSGFKDVERQYSIKAQSGHL